MVIIIDMENGERIFVQGAKQENMPLRLTEAGWVCPELQPYPATIIDERIMLALMEYPFVTTR